MDIKAILQVAQQGGASDIHLKVGLPPLFRISGGLVPLRNAPRLTAELMKRLLEQMARRPLLEVFVKERELDFAYTAQGMGRFRVNAFMQRQNIGMVLRVIASEVKGIDDLGLPVVLKEIAAAHRGLVLVTGATGSGKSTTLAAMVNEVNVSRAAHIVTVEDPIEYVFRDKRSIINQREVGDDTQSFARALRSALRQDPDCILVGEMRDQETIETALSAAETGHLVLSTLHTVDAPDTVNRIIGMFPPHQHSQIRGAVSANLEAVISQRLVKRCDTGGRVAAMEIMRSTARVRELLQENRLLELREAIAAGKTTYGMQTFDQSLMQLLNAGIIAKDEALDNATNKDDFLLRLAGVQGASDGAWEAFD
jgi:twitching motility protein PilT